jgi:hypothetical protein
MIIETIRSFTDALNNGTYGVNAQIASLPLDGSDTRPVVMALIADETRNTGVALNAEPATLPAITVHFLDASDFDGEVQASARHRNGSVTIYARGVWRQSKTDAGVTAIYYVTRAMLKCLAAFMSAAHESDRLRNSVQIWECTSVSVMPVHVPDSKDDNLLAGGIKATFNVRDLSP